MRTGNPALKNETFKNLAVEGERMTLNGTVGKCALMLVLLLITAIWTWGQFMQAVSTAGVEAAMSEIMPYIWGGLIGGLVLALITIFAKKWAAITAPLYALAEGFALGGISAFFELQYPGIVIQAVGLTFGTLAALLIAYRTGLIKVTENFRMGVAAATGGIFLLYMANMLLRMFTDISIPFIHESGWMGIGFSLFVVVIAALNLVLDFDFIESGVEMGAPKYMEWFGAFGLIVTLVWLYLEILRLLGKLRQ
ncbi:MAG TPA: Bax inhibitor-1/YccA family protein [Gammaproteobacteria bacterium]|nr:Bax inhibitor-1/YccA family protein [Gammaproteobacteria bacterium]